MELKRQRSPNFTGAEIKTLLAGIADNRRTIFSPIGADVSHLDKETVWNSILESVNAVGGFSRTAKEIKKKFHDMNSRTKCRMLQLKREKANGKLRSKPLTPAERKIISLYATTEKSNLTERTKYDEDTKGPILSIPQPTDTSESSSTSSLPATTSDTHSEFPPSHSSSLPLQTFKYKNIIPNQTIIAVGTRQQAEQEEKLQRQHQSAEILKDQSSPGPLHKCRRLEHHRRSSSSGLMNVLEIFSRNQLQLVAAMNRQADELAAIRKLLEKFLTER